MAHSASHTLIEVTDRLREVVAQGLQVTIPVWSVDCIDSVVLILHNCLIGDDGLPRLFGDKWIEAWGQLDDPVEVIGMEGALQVRQSVEHLGGSLRVSRVEDLLLASLLLDHRDIGNIVIETHVGPGPHPVLIVVLGGEGLVVP